MSSLAPSITDLGKPAGSAETMATLKAENAELRQVLDAVPSRIWYKDDNNGIVSLNRTAAQSMGLAREDVEGRNTYDLFGDQAVAYHKADLEVIESGKPIHGLIERFTPAQGSIGWSRTDKIPLRSAENGERRLLVVSTDITELTEQQAKLEGINKNLEDFASLASHDLQAPLRHIAIFADLLSAQFGEAIPEEAQDHLANILNGVSDMRQMIQTFLRFVREAPSDFVPRPVNISAVAAAAVKRVKSDLEQINGDVSLPEFEVWAEGDSFLLTQVFTNLFDNAIKYHHPDRPLRISVTSTAHDGEIVVTVDDTASGIDLREAPQIFDLFARAKPANGVTGSGIGLALCKRIAVHHGGSITLEPCPHPGSRFVLRLNQARTPAP